MCVEKEAVDSKNKHQPQDSGYLVWEKQEENEIGEEKKGLLL